MKHALIFGHGYSAASLTPLLLADGWQVSGTTRHRAQAVAAAGATPVDWGGDAAIRAAIATANAILVSAGPDATGDPVLARFRDGLRTASPDWVGYLSTTAVYGDHGGDWVTEDTPTAPASARGKARVQAENAWCDLAAQAGWPLHIFRLAGIYGPGRSPVDKLRQGKSRRIIKPGQIFSRIHVDDIGQVLAASIRQPQPGAVYNVCDDLPCPPQEVIEYAAAKTGLPLPRAEDFDTAEMTPMARSFYSESKRVSNRRIKSDLGVRLLYPDYFSGLAGLI